MATRLLFSVPYFIFSWAFFPTRSFSYTSVNRAAPPCHTKCWRHREEGGCKPWKAGLCCETAGQEGQVSGFAVGVPRIKAPLGLALAVWACTCYGPCLGHVCEMGLKGPRSEACWEEGMRQLTKWGQRRGTLEMWACSLPDCRERGGSRPLSL